MTNESSKKQCIPYKGGVRPLKGENSGLRTYLDFFSKC